MVCYTVSLQGPEGLLLDMEGLLNHSCEEKFTVIALLGTVKGEHNVRQHLLPAVNVTSSGIQVWLWIR